MCPAPDHDLFQNADGFCLEDPLKVLPTPRFAFRPAKKAAPVIITGRPFGSSTCLFLQISQARTVPASTIHKTIINLSICRQQAHRSRSSGRPRQSLQPRHRRPVGSVGSSCIQGIGAQIAVEPGVQKGSQLADRRSLAPHNEAAAVNRYPNCIATTRGSSRGAIHLIRCAHFQMS
jgi:hypothetical protein